MTTMRRLQQGVFESLASANRFAGSGGGTGANPMKDIGHVAASSLGSFSSTSWTDIGSTSFTVQFGRPMFFLYLIFAAGNATPPGTANGYVRGNIVGFDTTNSIYLSSNALQYMSGFAWYYPPAPIQPGSYTVKLQCKVDTGATATVQNIWHQMFAIGV